MAATIERAYCWEMQKIANQYQMRVAFFSNENTYRKFHFYCIYCGIPLEGKNIMKHRDLNFSKHKTPHFAVWKGKMHAAKCPSWKTTSSGTGTGTKKTSSSEDFYYTHFLLNPLDTGLVPHVPSAPSILSKTILETAVIHNTGHTIEQTSIFKDIVDCYIELREKNQLNDIQLHIEDAPSGTTYNQIFKPIRFISDFFTDGYLKIKHRVHYGDILNKSINEQKDPDHWSFYVMADKKFAFFKDQNNATKPVLLEVLLPVALLDTNLQMKAYIQDQLDAGKRLHECYIVNTEPEPPRLVEKKEDPTKFHYESQIRIQNLNHIVLTFKE